MGKANLKVVSSKMAEIPFQEASLDIWDRKYRLKSKDGQIIDKTIYQTYERVAKALSEVEETEEKRQEWYKEFLWALDHGAIPAGRIMSNAGALDYKPATSTINCTVSGSIRDSMSDILQKVTEAGLTLKAGCGIGYEFSTLRPKGAYVSGAGAYTSGPLSFMDIYDKMCFTVSSAGGRRGAQMSTFDIGHPDVVDYIRAKREDGRLRQFNLSLLITREFMEAVKHNAEWPLAFPLSSDEADGIDLHDSKKVVWREWPIHDDYLTNEEGKVACKVYKSMKARRLWDLIMSSTYDFAEPGFILIDQYNEMNNNWFCENIRATNPCVTDDTWVHTLQGPQQVKELIGKAFHARVDGELHASGPEGFFKTDIKPVLRIKTVEGYEMRLTGDHRIRKVKSFKKDDIITEWCTAAKLKRGDRLLLNDHHSNAYWDGAHNFDEGFVVGGLVAEDHLEYVEGITTLAAADAGGGLGVSLTTRDMGMPEELVQDLPEFDSEEHSGQETQASSLNLHSQLNLARDLGIHPGHLRITPEMEKASSQFYQGFLRGYFDTAAQVESTGLTGVFISLPNKQRQELLSIQRMLLRLGITSYVDKGRQTSGRAINKNFELIISGEDLYRYQQVIGFSITEKAKLLEEGLEYYKPLSNIERFTARVEAVVPDGVETVYDVQIPGINTFDANGFHSHNCGEQGLPPYGSCLLGSINLTKFVEDPFSDNARFNWDEYKKVVSIFTRMLDNVVEINGLPLEQQRAEITNKRRHGMGFLGLGSTLTMLKMKYGSEESVEFTERVTRELALTGWQQALDLALEKGPAPIMEYEYEVNKEMLSKRPEMKLDGWRVGDKIKGKVLHAKYSRYMQKIAQVAPELVEQLSEVGARFTHHSSIAPTGTISLSLANNASNGIEPSFAHHYFRNVIREGKKSKEKVDVYSFEMLAYRHLSKKSDEDKELPDYFITAEDIKPKEHVDIQAASQKWIDSSISKTANVPTDFNYEEFKDIYMYAYEQGLKGCTTFRFNPEAFQGVLVKENDLANTTYKFTLEDGSEVELKGNEEIEYDGEIHTAANLYDALKEGYYGKF